MQRDYKQALITGASSGIGEAIAVLLAEQKIPLFLTGRDETRLKAVARRLESLTHVEYAAYDLSTQESRKPLVEWIHTHAPDLVIQSAGFGLYGPALQQDPKELLNMVDTNVSAVLEIALSAAKALSERKQQGTLLHVSSVAAVITMPNFSVYSATKACLLHLSECLDFEWRPYGIRVLTLCPGHVTTRFQEHASKGAAYMPVSYALSAEQVARAALRQINYQKRTCFFDWRSQLIAFLCRYVLPKSWVAAFTPKRPSKKET